MSRFHDWDLQSLELQHRTSPTHGAPSLHRPKRERIKYARINDPLRVLAPFPALLAKGLR
jgi:hypothetical protein